jgi:hypothetical protein
MDLLPNLKKPISLHGLLAINSTVIPHLGKVVIYTIHENIK